VLLEYLAADLCQAFANLSLVLTFRKQVDRRFSPEIFQIQLATRRIRPMQPIQKWLARSHHDCCSVDGGHSVSAGRLPLSGGLPVIVVQHPTQTLAVPDRAIIPSVGFVRSDQPVAEALVVALAM
jgi:hypothetical protein